MIIAKFGGTSLSKAEYLRTLAEITKKEIKKRPVVVVSAVGGVTNLLASLSESSPSQNKETLKEIKRIHIELAKNLFGGNMPEDFILYIEKCVVELSKLIIKNNKNKESIDRILSYGEMMSSYIVSAFLSSLGIIAKQVLATDIIITDNNFGSAEFLPKPTKKKVGEVLKPLIRKGIVPVVTGFIASTKDGHTTTLGRGGSDYTASILGFSLGASEIQIWTDVNGIYTADPRIVGTAKFIHSVSFREASELAAFGAKVIHHRAMRPAVKALIPVKVLNTFNPDGHGTLIKMTPLSEPRVTAITSKKKITLINLYSSEMLLSKGFLMRIFNVFAKNNISVDLVSVSEVSVSVTLDNSQHLASALTELSEFTSVAKIPDFGIVSLVGEEIVKIPHIMKKIFTILDKEKIFVKMISLGATNINISLVIPTDRIEDAVKALHNNLIKI